MRDRIEIEVLDLGQREDQADRRHEQLEGRTDEEADGDAVILGHHTQQPGTHGRSGQLWRGLRRGFAWGLRNARAR